MKTKDIEMGVYYLAEIKALKEYKKTTTGYYYQRQNESKSIHEGVVSLMGNDCGKFVSIDTKMKEKIAIGNRVMMYDIEKLVEKRITELEMELKNFNGIEYPPTSLEKCPFNYCDSNPKCEGKCRYNN